MSQSSEGGSSSTRSGPDTGLEALRRNGAFRGPVEPLDDHEHVNDHLALVYENQAEQFAAAMPYVRQGLDLGERCVYITHENSRADVEAAMRSYGIDVDEALASGALSIHSEEETYLRTGAFDAEDTLSFLDDAIAEAAEEYAAFRVTGEMSFVLGDDPAVEDLMVCESKANYLFEDVDGMALCQYNRERFPPEVIRDVINTHPHIVHGDRVSRNSYYTPPSEFLGPERPDSEVERMMGTLREQTDARVALRENREFLRESYAITSDPERSFEEKLERLLDLGRERFDMEIGCLTHLSSWDDEFRIEAVVGADGGPVAGPLPVQPGTGCFCRRAVDAEGPVCVGDAREAGWESDPIHERNGLTAYFGTRVSVGGEPYGTLWFGSPTPREESFSDVERAYLELMGQWVSYELGRRRSQRELEATVAQLRRSNDRLQQFAFAASHDLQEPLRMVSSYLQLLEDEYGGQLDDVAAEYIDFAVDGADRMRAMVDDLLAFARVEQADGQFEQVDIGEVLDRVRDDLRVQIESTNASITADSLPEVTADPDQLEQLFRNLVSNAIKYSGDADPEIEVDATEQADYWELSVADNGIGIDPEKTDQIFEVFKRLHHGDEYQGTGVGLSLCQEIAENHGGEIRVDSEPGEGSTFTVTLSKQHPG